MLSPTSSSEIAVSADMNPGIDFVSGRPVEFDTSYCTTIADIRCQIATVLKVPWVSVRLVTTAGFEPSDGDHIDLIYMGVTTIIIDNHQSEAQFLKACRVVGG